MELLHLLFPGLIGFDESEVPSWGGLVDPWDVFNGDYNIKYQINLLLENG